MDIQLVSHTPEHEKLIERMARISHKSEDRITETSSRKMIKRLIEMGHTSVLEHASASFIISGVSRSLTHQLVRHRHMSVTQKSQRYVSEYNFEYVTPDLVIRYGFQDEFEKDMEVLRNMYSKWRANLAAEDARFVLPNACTTEIGITANFRELRHIFNLRCDPNAQWEIRRLCCVMADTVYNIAPSVFEDIMEKVRHAEG